VVSLPQELQLAKITTAEAAKELPRTNYIAKFNKQFAVAAEQKGDGVPTIAPPRLELDLHDSNRAGCGEGQQGGHCGPFLALDKTTFRNILAGSSQVIHEHRCVSTCLRHLEA
jgi:hypothetical protein